MEGQVDQAHAALRELTAASEGHISAGAHAHGPSSAAGDKAGPPSDLDLAAQMDALERDLSAFESSLANSDPNVRGMLAHVLSSGVPLSRFMGDGAHGLGGGYGAPIGNMTPVNSLAAGSVTEEMLKDALADCATSSPLGTGGSSSSSPPASGRSAQSGSEASLSPQKHRHREYSGARLGGGDHTSTSAAPAGNTNNSNSSGGGGGGGGGPRNYASESGLAAALIQRLAALQGEENAELAAALLAQLQGLSGFSEQVSEATGKLQ